MDLNNERRSGSMRVAISHFSFAVALCAMLLAQSAYAQVGMRQLTLDQVPVTMTYPTTATSAPVRMGQFELNVAMNAPLSEMAPNGKRRLILISHGTGGSAPPDHDLAHALAKAGFVVAQLLHEGDNYKDARDAGPVAFERRPREVFRVVEALAQSAQWANVLDLSKIGVHGMSAGGVTGLALAGGQWRTLNLVQHCNRVGDADIGFCLQGANSEADRNARQARYRSAKNVPEIFLPKEIKVRHGGVSDRDDPRPDPRIAAVSLAVPVAAIFSAESLRKVSIPIGVVVAEQDEVLVPQYHADHVLANVPGAQRLITLKGAGHFDVLSPWPAEVAEAVGRGQVRGGMPRLATNDNQRQLMRERIVEFHTKHLLQ